MCSVKKYYFSQFANLFLLKRLSVATDDVEQSLFKLIEYFDKYFSSSDIQVSPVGTCEYIIFTKQCPSSGEILGYKFFWSSFTSNSTCEFFETYVSEEHRKEGIATELITLSLDWAMRRGSNEFSFALLKNEDGINYLESVYRRMEERLKESCRFIFKQA